MSQEPMNNQDQEGRDLDAIYAATPRDEPPAALDATILAASKQSSGGRATLPWQAPLAMAAVLVLGIAVGILMVMEEPPPSESDLLTAQIEAPQAADQEQPGVLAERHFAEAPAKAKTQANAEAPAQGFLSKQESVAPAKDVGALRDQPAPTPRPATARVEKPAAPAAELRARAAREQAAVERKKQRRQEQAKRVTAQSAEAVAKAEAEAETNTRAGANADAASAAAPEVKISIPMDSLADLHEAVIPSPEQQKKLDEIQRLLDRHRSSSARRRLREFMRSWPDYPRQDLERRFGAELVNRAAGG